MTAYYNENNAHAAAWLRNLQAENIIPPGEVDERSIVDVTPGDLEGFTQCHFFAGIGGWAYAARLAGWPDDLPLWSASLPCQPFSVAGRGGDCLTAGIYGLTSTAFSVPDGPLSSWESRLRKRLASLGSTEFVLIWKEAVTPAGESLSRLSRSMRLQRESVSGLWPWPTPRATDGMGGIDPKSKTGKKLRTIATWATPIASNWRSGSVSPETFSKNSRPLNEQAVTFGRALIGSRAQTVSSGALSPALPCWLMGYPKSWLRLCPALATQSSRSSRPKS